jgi:two-component system C4-dicarboxylate transport response regulator DctD
MAHDWRGNVRELRNVAERLVLNIAPRTGGLAATIDGQARQHTLPEQLDAVERTLIKTALAECDSNMQRAADILGIPRRTLAEKMHRHGIAKKEG